MPHVEVPGGMTSHEYLSKKCYDALYDFCERTNYEIDCAKYYDRLEYELSILKKHDVSDYFLIDEDIIRYARDNGILTGPGRGSASGSLVSYLLGITRIDPLGYNTNVELMFERFLSPERKELPDIDSDLEPERRKDVLRYLRRNTALNELFRLLPSVRWEQRQSSGRGNERLRYIKRNHKTDTCIY